MIEFYRGTVNGAGASGVVLKNLPAGGTVLVQTDADVTVSFWNDADGAYGATNTISSPGEKIDVFHHHARLNSAAPAAVQIIKGS